jgi:CENP-B N-terminal DNA-binding domain
MKKAPYDIEVAILWGGWLSGCRRPLEVYRGVEPAWYPLGSFLDGARSRKPSAPEPAESRAERRAQSRQEAWSNLGRWHQAWPGDAELAYNLTKKLNGHADELEPEPDCPPGLGHRRRYIDGDSGLWGKRRQKDEDRARWWEPLPPEDVDADRVMHSNRGLGAPDEDHGGQFGADLLSHGGFHETAGAGGDHDRAYLLYGLLGAKFSHAKHRDVLTRPGRLPADLRPARNEVEQIIRMLHEAKVSQAEIARLFQCSRKTIVRICASELVPVSSMGEGDDVSNQLLERLDVQDKALHRIESTLAAIAETLFVNRLPASVFDDVVGELISRSWLKEAA